jgi:heme/copper-type cytochrome/quinol oxidase subunit 4
MKKTFSRRHWIANGVASIVFLLCAITAIYYTPFEPTTRIALAFLSIVLLLMCFYFWQPHESGKEKMDYWVWFTVFGVAWTFVGFGIGALIYRVSYLGLLTLQSAAWKSLGWMGPLAVGPLLVVLGLVSIMRKAILNLLNN